MYYVYILKCSDDLFYTGIATDVGHRVKVHESGKGSKYVCARLPVKVVYTEEFPDRSGASIREAEIKSWSRTEKISNLKLLCVE